MYSSLTNQAEVAGLREVSDLTAARRRFATKDWPHVLLVRNPIDRTVSAWRDKIVAQPRAFGTDEFVGWQRSQRVVLRAMGMAKRPESERADALANVSFSRFVELLPRTYLLDGHFQPQHMRLTYRLRTLAPIMPAGITEWVQVEGANPTDVAERFGIDMTRRDHRTDHITTPTVTPADRAIIERLYRRDFEKFGYSSS